MPKNSQCCDVRAGDSVSVLGDVVRMQLPTLPAVTKSAVLALGHSQPVLSNVIMQFVKLV